MSDERVCLILSDLHLGGGPADPGDDHLYQGAPLERLIDQQTATTEGQAGGIELIFNGDFLEFAQANQGAFSHTTDGLWCTESESLAKLQDILDGHPGIFAALRRFQTPGNLVTIAAGNHDVDLAWPTVQARLREVAGDGLRFEIGKTWLERHDGRLQIGHGHMHDAANKFEHWDDPIRHGAWGVPRLEMCPGTLFMVKFVNRLEAKYPFADNLMPVTKLFAILLRDDKAGLGSVAWLFAKLVASTSPFTLETAAPDDIGPRLLQRARDDAGWRAEVEAALASAGFKATHDAWTLGPIKSSLLQHAMLDLLGRLDDADWHRLFDPPAAAGELGVNDGLTLEALRKAAFEDGKMALRQVARDRAATTCAEVVVMGHTHQPDQASAGVARYFNPGCWTRYLELAPGQRITLEDLKDENRFPFALNYVRVAPGTPLNATMPCFEQSAP